MKILLRWPQCNADYTGPRPRPTVLDTNVVLDLLVFDDPLAQPIRHLLEQGQLCWIADEAQRIELGRVLTYSKVAPRVAFYEKTVEGVLAAFDAAVQYVPAAPKVRFTCTDPDDQHFLDLAAQHRALLISKDKAVLKQRKRLSTWFGATIGNLLVLDTASAENS